MIPVSDPKGQFIAMQQTILQKINEVLVSGQYIMGPNVKKLETEIARKIGVTDAIAVGNGTDALVITLEAFGVGPGDEIITTPFSFFATAEAITRVGATPIFVDVDRKTFNLDPEKVSEQITPATKAILPVHLFGQTANMQAIKQIAKQHDLFVIEDACQAFGAEYRNQKVGGLGDAGCFSFFPTKNLSTIGDGGIITTSNKELANKIRMLRTHGSKKKYFHSEIGYNSRLDEIHAAILLVCLDYVDSWNENRIMLANRYHQQLQNVANLKLPRVQNPNEKKGHVYHLYCIETDVRKTLMEYLHKNGIQTGIYYPLCLHLQEAYTHLGYKKGDFPIAELLSEKLFAIPLFPYLSMRQQDQIIASLKRFGVHN